MVDEAVQEEVVACQQVAEPAFSKATAVLREIEFKLKGAQGGVREELTLLKEPRGV